MKLRALVCALAIVVATGLVTSRVVSQQPESKEKPPAFVQPSAEMEKMMARCAKFAAPGEEHREMAKSVGSWDVLSRCWMSPGAPPTETKGNATIKAILGGRFLTQEYKGDFMGQPFEGLGIDGYDKTKKKYVSVWIDTMSTAVTVMTGECDSEAGVCTYFGTMDDPAAEKRDKIVKSVVREIGDDKVMFEMFDIRPDGTEFKRFEMEYTRRKT